MVFKLVNVNRRKIRHLKQLILHFLIRTTVCFFLFLVFFISLLLPVLAHNVLGRNSPSISEAAACSSEHHQQSNLDLSSPPPPPQTMSIPSTNYSNGCTPDSLLYSYETSNPHHHFYSNCYTPSPPIKQLTSQFDYHHHLHHHHLQPQHHHHHHQQQQSHYYHGSSSPFTKVKHENQSSFATNDTPWMGHTNFGV